MTPVSIARRYAASRVSKHVFDVGGKGWIGVNVVPELACRDAKLDRKPEDVDERLALMSDKMRPEDAIGHSVDHIVHHAAVSA